jgi:outer membrane lipoprotein carrier protein
MRRAWVGVVAALALCAPGVAAVRSPAAPAAGLQAWLDGTKTLAGSFEQTLVSGALGQGASERGKLWLERPGRLRWDYAEPDPKVAVVVEGKTSLYLPDDKQLIRGTLGVEQAALPELLASGGRLTDLFDVSAVASAAGDPPGAARLRLVPRRGSGSVEEVVLVLDGRRFEILRAEVRDAAGNRTAYRFWGWRRNRPIPPGLFAFEPPPGTEVLDQR